MKALFENSTPFLFFFAMIAIFNYTDMKLEQRISLIYVSVYALVVLEIIGSKLAFLFLALTMLCYLEIFTNDSMKLKLLINPIYKLIDCIYLSVSQYYLVYIMVSVLCFNYRTERWLGEYAVYLKLFSVLPLGYGIISVLRQKYTINTFEDMFVVFMEYPIQTVSFNDKLKDVCSILVSIEDRGYFRRKAYTFLSLPYLLSGMKRKLSDRSFKEKMRCGSDCIKSVITGKRGYSTLPMQLIRTLGIKSGYSCKVRRKIYELLYPKMFFGGIKRLFKEECVSKRHHFKHYLLYIYFHIVNTYLGDASFSKFLNAFDMQYHEKNKIDIYDCSNEGVFIACMGLNKRASKINNDNIDYYLSPISVPLDRERILNMVDTMMNKPHNGNYLK